MNSNHLDIVILGLSISSSWGNGHATTYRGLIRELALRGHRIIFLERDKPWYANNRDFESDGSFELAFYDSLDDLHERFGARVRGADFVIVGSYVPEGAALGRWVVNAAEGATAFYDIDTPVTLAQLERGECDYLDPALIARYDR
jgi:spore maturation protein CgeB